MINLKRPEECCGCTACMSICPARCITMQSDFEGFKYPVIDISRCIECHKCESVCPVINGQEKDNNPIAYLARTQDKDLLANCTSGGVFTEIAREIVRKGGVAYGAVFGVGFEVVHERISQLDDIDRLSGSKYVQSDMEEIFSQVKKDVNLGIQVVFCGTPCQIAGLRGFLGKDFDNIVLVDLVCHGVPSPKLWKRYVKYLEDKYGKLIYVNFRSKRLGYHISVMEERFENGKTRIGSARTNFMSKCFFKNAADRPICYECPFKKVSHSSDLTLFDGWHASEYIKGFYDDDRGYTIILAQSLKGRRLIEGIDNIKHMNIDINNAILLDGKMVLNSVNRPEERNTFYRMLEENGIEEVVNRLFPVTKCDYLIEKIKILFDKIGILKLIIQIIRTNG